VGALCAPKLHPRASASFFCFLFSRHYYGIIARPIIYECIIISNMYNKATRSVGECYMFFTYSTSQAVTVFDHDFVTGQVYASLPTPWMESIIQ